MLLQTAQSFSEQLKEMRSEMRRIGTHKEGHLVSRIGWLRAAVLGANDGIVSTASLIVGVAAAAAQSSEVLINKLIFVSGDDSESFHIGLAQALGVPFQKGLSAEFEQDLGNFSDR